MAIDSYRISRAGTEITDDLPGAPFNDEDAARTAAAEASNAEPGAPVVIESVGTEPSGQWVSTVASYKDGRPHPWYWTVTYRGPMLQDDAARLNEQGITVMRSENGIQKVAVEAPSGEEAAAKVQEALGARKMETTAWTHEEADDDSIRVRRDQFSGG